MSTRQPFIRGFKLSSALEEWGKIFGNAYLGLSSAWDGFIGLVLGRATEVKVGEGPLVLEGTLRDPDGNPIRNAKLTLRNARYRDLVLGESFSSSEGKYRFTGFPLSNCILDVEEPGKYVRTVYIDIVEEVTGRVTYPGKVWPMDLTVPHLEAPQVTYKITPPAMPEYKPRPKEPPRIEPYVEPKVCYA